MIQVEKIRAEIERRRTEIERRLYANKPGDMMRLDELDEVLSIFDALEAEELPSNLYEAAEEYAEEEMMGGLAERAFKAGAGWMAGQGETFNGYISVKGKRSLIAIEGKPDMYKFGDKVIVQIRQKDG